MIKSTWVELSLTMAYGAVSTDLGAFANEEAFVTAMCDKWVDNKDKAKSIEPHVTLLWCGKGTSHEEVCGVLSDILKHEDYLPQISGTGKELEAMGRYCIALPVTVHEALWWKIHDLAKTLYDRLPTLEGMVDPNERPWNPHITLFDLEPSTEKRDMALHHLRTMGRLGVFKGKPFFFKQMFTVVSKLDNGNLKHTNVLFGWDKESKGKIEPRQTCSF